MSFYLTLQSSRTTPPDPAALLPAVRTAVNDPAAGMGQLTSTSYIVKKSTAFTNADMAAAQQAIDNAPALTPQRTAQNAIDNWPIEIRALLGSLLDQLNTLRAALPTPLPAITPAQALTAVRNKAATLS